MRNAGVRIVIIVAAIAAALTASRMSAHAPAPAVARGTSVTTAAPAAPGAGAVAPSASATAITHPEIGFHSHARLAEHFAKHGAEFGAASPEDYLRLVQTLRDRPAGGDVLEQRRGDGTLCRFDRRSGAFLAFDPDLTIRTFFRPNDGERYFQRQLEREH